MTDTQFDLILKNGTAVLPGQTVQANIGVSNGKIAAIGVDNNASAKEVIDCTGLHILPGVIDTQVHFREPGLTHKEDLYHGSKAAIAGGVTAFFEMPNTKPLTVTPETLKAKLDSAAVNSWADYAFYLGGTANNAKDLAAWEKQQGVCGIKIFMGASTGDLLTSEDDMIEAVLANGQRVVAVHAEDEAIMNANKASMLGENPPVTMHPVWRSVESCVSATTRVLNIARKTGRRVHILHITTADEMEILAQNRDVATVEVLANHLTLHAPDCYEQIGSKAQQNPPIREKHHQDGLWKAINDGLVDILGSDHAAHTLDEKSQPYPASPSGTPGVQTLVPIMLNHVNNGKLTLERFVDLVCEGPLRIHGLVGKGRISRGYDANFTIVDMNAKRTITNAQQHSKSRWTPFDGMDVKGWPVRTILRGKSVMIDDEIIGEPSGEMIRFRETLT